MKALTGFLIVLVSVVGGYLLSHGNLSALFQPFELLIIGGAAIGAFVVTNPGHLIKQVAKDLLGLFRAPLNDRKAAVELLSCLYAMAVKVRKDGVLTLERDIDAPEESPLFEKYPSVLANPLAMEFLQDHIRLLLTGEVTSHNLDDLLEAGIETFHADAKASGDALNKVADALPGFGIVAAVLGVVITMGSLDQPPQILGDHIAAALVGTFLGILLAYGFVGPMAAALHHRAEDQGAALLPIKAFLLALDANYPPMITAELSRKALPHHLRPSFMELEASLRSNKPTGGVPEKTQEAG